MNILLVTSAPPKVSPFSTSEKRPPLGVGSLIALLRSKGHRVFFIDNYLEPSSFLEEGFLQKNSIDYFGVYVNTICFRDSLRMFQAAQQLRERGEWQGKMIAGGPHTAVALHTLPSFVDHVVLGEGEEALLEILSGKSRERVIRKTMIKDLDSLPFQPWDLFTAMAYDFTCPWIPLEPVYTMNTSRGCPFNCSFCSVGSIWGRQYTYYSADRVIAEIQYLVKHHNARGIYFREDNFTLNTKRTLDFCEKIIAQNIPISWACETRVDNLTEELISFMAKAGCEAFYLGVESGSQRMLDRMNKNINLEQVERVVTWCKMYGIKTYCSLIAGVPGETYGDYRTTVGFMKRIKPYSYAFNVYVGLADSPMYRDVLKNKLYEFQDETGLLYLPGFDVKVRYFYNQDSRGLVDYGFKWSNRSLYDHILVVRIFARRVKNFILRRLRRLFNKG